MDHQIPVAASPIRGDDTAAGRSRADDLAARLAQRLIEEDAQVGDHIGTLTSIRSQTGLARSTVSEAVRLLRERGVIEIRPGRGGGLFVAASNPVVRMRHTLLTARHSASSVTDAIAVREALEELVAVDAARHRSADDERDLRGLLAAMAAATSDFSLFMKANWALHDRIATITPNTLAGAVYRGTLGELKSTTPDFDSPAPVERYLGERLAIHEDLVNAIAVGDISATREAVKRHNEAI